MRHEKSQLRKKIILGETLRTTSDGNGKSTADCNSVEITFVIVYAPIGHCSCHKDEDADDSNLLSSSPLSFFALFVSVGIFAVCDPHIPLPIFFSPVSRYFFFLFSFSLTYVVGVWWFYLSHLDAAIGACSTDEHASSQKRPMDETILSFFLSLVRNPFDNWLYGAAMALAKHRTASDACVAIAAASASATGLVRMNVRG